MKILVLEDNKCRREWFKYSDLFKYYTIVICKTVEEAEKALLESNVEFDLIFLDHDLGKVRDGYDFAKLLAEEIRVGRVTNDPSIYIHSLNPVGVANMKSVLRDATIIPFSELIKKIK